MEELHGVHLVVTHSGAGATALIQVFQSMGAQVSQVPLTEFTDPEDAGGVRQQLRNLGEVQWLLVSSPHAAEVLAGQLDVQNWPDVRFAAVGEATAEVLRTQGFPVDFVPGRASGTALGQELPARAGELALHLTSDRARDDLPTALRARGIRYQRLTLYRTRLRPPSETERRVLHSADVVTLASSSAAEQLALSGELAVPVAVMGQQTARTARQLGFQTVWVAQEATLAGLQQVVAEHLSSTT